MYSHTNGSLSSLGVLVVTKLNSRVINKYIITIFSPMQHYNGKTATTLVLGDLNVYSALEFGACRLNLNW